MASGHARSIRLLLAAAILLPLVTFAIAAWLNYRLLMVEAHRHAARSVEVVREQALRAFAVHELILAQVGRRVADRSWDDVLASRALHEELRDLATRSEETSSVFLLAPDGQRWLSSRRFPMPNIDATDRDYFQYFAGGGRGTFVSTSQKGRLENDPFFTIARALERGRSGFDGLMAVSVNVSYFEGVYKRLLESTDDVVSMVRADGALLVRYPRAFTIGYVFPPSAGLLQAIKEADHGFFPARARLDGVDRIYAYDRIGDYPIYIAYGLGTRGIWAQWIRNVLTFTAVTAATILLLSLAILQMARASRRERDALERWSAELARREAAEKALARVQRLDALGQLTGGVAHDFGNILQVLKANVAALRRGHPPTPQLVQALDRATDQGERLTRQLLAFSRQQDLAPATVGTLAFFTELRPLLAQSLASNIVLAVDVAPGVPDMRIDPHELELALLNIAINARDAMPHGGTFSVAVTAADGAIRVACRDTGTGMPPDVADRIFEPFFTTKAEGKGTGLGLAQVYGFITQSGGSVSVESALGRGTELVLTLPAATAAAAADRAIDASGSEATAQR